MARHDGAAGPLAGVRILEVSTGRPARIAGMLLADLGADVVRAIDPAAPVESLTPATVCWDRGKRLHPIPVAGVAAIAGRADILIVDRGPTALGELGWDSAAFAARHPGLIHLWMPPYGEFGEWRDVAEDPLLLAALAGLAVYYPAEDDSPVAPVTAALTHLHGAIGAAAGVAALVGRQRHGVAQPAVVAGLHAAATLMGATFTEFNDAPGPSPTRAIKWTPQWRAYRCADDEWLFLAALTPEIFFRALDVLGCLDVMALPEVAGDFYSILDMKRGRPAVTARLEPVFAAEPSSVWMERLQAARVPAAMVQTRETWFDATIVRENGIRYEADHPTLGRVAMPNVAMAFADTPTALRGFAQPVPSDVDTGEADTGEADPAAQLWPPGGAEVWTSNASTHPAPLPLDGVRVVDCSTFQAGPQVATLMADYGADVVHVERPGGDPYRAYSLSFLAINQRKQSVVLDLKQTAEVERMHRLLARADVFVENLRPTVRADLDLDLDGGDGNRSRFPHLVHLSVSAFGQAADYADSPGFDPIFQALNGMAAAQGAATQPIICTAPFNDAATASLGALASLAALYHREIGGRGQQLWVSLAASSTFVQSAEFTSWAGAPTPQQGDVVFRGPDDGCRYYECTDGWVAVAAHGADQRARLRDVLGVADLAEAAKVLAGYSTGAATGLLIAAGITACRVVPRRLPLRDPFLVENNYSHLVSMPEGIARLPNHLSRWPAAPEPVAARYFEPDADAAAVWAATAGPR